MPRLSDITKPTLIIHAKDDPFTFELAKIHRQRAWIGFQLARGVGFQQVEQVTLIDALDYYRQCSAMPRLSDITKPTLIIHAKDDPFMEAHAFELAKIHRQRAWIGFQLARGVGFQQVEQVTLHGFADALDYYRQCSAMPRLSDITKPTLIIHAKESGIRCSSHICGFRSVPPTKPTWPPCSVS
jgi:predicted alpha/beta-fold hydrolase